jgi:hypothetical protein
MVKVCMHQVKKVVLPTDDPREQVNWTLAQFLTVVAGKRVPVRAGHTVVGFVDNFRIDGDRVVGEFREQCE